MVSSDSTPDPTKSSQAANAIRDLSGKFSKTDPPFVSFSITNPVTYIRKWWKSVMDGEGVDLRLKIHPMTAVLIVLAVGGASFGVGRLAVPEPILKYIPILASPIPTSGPIATPEPWIETALTGILQAQGTQYFLIGQETQAIKIELPAGATLEGAIGKRVLVSGQLQASTRILRVQNATQVQIISGITPLRAPRPTSTASVSAQPSQ